MALQMMTLKKTCILKFKVSQARSWHGACHSRQNYALLLCNCCTWPFIILKAAKHCSCTGRCICQAEQTLKQCCYLGTDICLFQQVWNSPNSPKIAVIAVMWLNSMYWWKVMCTALLKTPFSNQHHVCWRDASVLPGMDHPNWKPRKADSLQVRLGCCTITCAYRMGYCLLAWHSNSSGPAWNITVKALKSG